MHLRSWIGSIALFVVVAGVGGGLAAWKRASIEASDAARAQQPEPVEAVTAAEAIARTHRKHTTAIGTIVALRSVTLRNELAGTVSNVQLAPGAVVEEGALLVALDVSVEEAELAAQEARAALAQSLLDRTLRASENRAAPAMEVDRTKAERDIALAEVARTKAIIARKTVRAPFRARVGLSDVHPGQYLDAGAELTTLQGVDDAVHVDFSVTQEVAAGLREGDVVEVLAAEGAEPRHATIVAVDSRVHSTTRNAMVRARSDDASGLRTPGASVRVRVPVGPPSTVVIVPASALRRGPAGDHVFVLETDAQGRARAHERRVTAGAALGEQVVIESGLAAGEQVAAAGSFKLREAALVAVASASDAPATAPQ